MSQTTQINVRIDVPILEKIDEFRRNQPDLPNRPEAIRRLVERGIEPVSKTLVTSVHDVIQPDNSDEWIEHDDSTVERFLNFPDIVQYIDEYVKRNPSTDRFTAMCQLITIGRGAIIDGMTIGRAEALIENPKLADKG